MSEAPVPTQDFEALSTTVNALPATLSDISSKEADIKAKYDEILAILSTATTTEASNASTMADFQTQIESLNLSSTLTNLQTIQADISRKAATLGTAKSTNAAKTAELFASLNASQAVINTILQIVEDINTNIATIKQAL